MCLPTDRLDDPSSWKFAVLCNATYGSRSTPNPFSVRPCLRYRATRRLILCSAYERRVTNQQSPWFNDPGIPGLVFYFNTTSPQSNSLLLPMISTTTYSQIVFHDIGYPTAHNFHNSSILSEVCKLPSSRPWKLTGMIDARSH